MLQRCQRVSIFFAAMAILLVSHATAWAQQAKAEEATQKPWAFSYFLVGLVVALALVIVMRGTSRRDKPKMVESELKHKLEQLQSKPKG